MHILVQVCIHVFESPSHFPNNTSIFIFKSLIIRRKKMVVFTVTRPTLSNNPPPPPHTHTHTSPHPSDRKLFFFFLFSKSCFKRKQKCCTLISKVLKNNKKITKFLAANTNFDYKIALLKHNDNQTYTFDFKKTKRKKKRKKIPTYRPKFINTIFFFRLTLLGRQFDCFEGLRPNQHY